MTTLTDRPNTAVLVIDMQNGVVAAAHRRDDVVQNINTVIGKARAADVPVLWVQHSDTDLPRGSEPWAYVPELVRAEDEHLVHKKYPDSFEDTDLESALAERRVGRLLITGASTDVCIRATLHGAVVRGYDTTLVADAHTTEDLTKYGAPPADQVIAHTNLYWTWHTAPGRENGTVETADIAF
ncbi:isochorismatase family protein [Streptomyces sp. J2-1]|uniref:isochorismatase family protein n=1 Tax=Streptomyces corallincola TaxID=2851888 RepID=UPI001C3819B4|nr:isochorismatase family protein [Streptomyces corallincola]MBV2356796.1 isochorismatase family protein [Streptomyces corallincola]